MKLTHHAPTRPCSPFTSGSARDAAGEQAPARSASSARRRRADAGARHRARRILITAVVAGMAALGLLTGPTTTAPSSSMPTQAVLPTAGAAQRVQPVADSLLAGSHADGADPGAAAQFPTQEPEPADPGAPDAPDAPLPGEPTACTGPGCIVQPLPDTPAPIGGGGGAPGAPPGTGDGSSCGVFDLAGCLSGLLNDFLRSVVTDALNPMLGLLGNTLLSTPNPSQLPHLIGGLDRVVGDPARHLRPAHPDRRDRGDGV